MNIKTERLVSRAQEIVSRADHEGRDLAPSERAQVEDLIDQARLEKSVDALGARLSDGGTEGLGRGIGDRFVASSRGVV